MLHPGRHLSPEETHISGQKDLELILLLDSQENVTKPFVIDAVFVGYLRHFLVWRGTVPDNFRTLASVRA